MKQIISEKIVVKIGTNVLTNSDGLVDEKIIEVLVSQLSQLINSGKKVVLVSSGAIGTGRTIKTKLKSKDTLSQRQIWAALGQSKLINIYSKLFDNYKIDIAQVLATKMDFSDRQHYLNIRRCVSGLLEENILPIINENDAVSVTELMFTDNDELASLISTMINADKLIILTNVDGLFTGDPSNVKSKLIKEVDSKNQEVIQFVRPTKSDFGRGGMMTKCKMALKTSKMGIDVYLANGKKPNILLDICSGKNEGTKFIAHNKSTTVKKWIGFSDGFTKGHIVVDKGLEEILVSKENIVSILPIGVVEVHGEFEKNELIGIFNSQNQKIGVGLSEFSAKETQRIIGEKGKQEIIHYDYLYID